MSKYIFILLVMSCLSCNSSKKIVYKTYHSGLKMAIVHKGFGPYIQKTQEIELYETVKYLSGKIIYSIEAPAKPFVFQVGVGHGIEGLEEALLHMKEGQISKLIIPPHLSRRSSYPPNLSPDSTLYNTIRIVRILKK